MGNIEQWAEIEILTFYANILIMIVYLCRHIFMNQQSTKEDSPAGSTKLKTGDEEEIKEDK
jgi:hypothetical protein